MFRNIDAGDIQLLPDISNWMMASIEERPGRPADQGNFNPATARSTYWIEPERQRLS